MDRKINIRTQMNIEASALGGIVEVQFQTAYSGGRLNLPNFEHDVYLDLATCSIADNLPIFLYHNHTRRVGEIKSYEIADNAIKMVGQLYTQLPDCAAIMTVHKNGGHWDCSIGTGSVPVEDQVYLAAGEQAEVNGNTIIGPAIIVRNVTIREISFVSAGADAATKVCIEASALNEKELKMTFDEFCKTFGLTCETDEQKAEMEKKYTDFIAAMQEKEEPEVVEAGCDEKPAEDKPVEASAFDKAIDFLQKVNTVNRPAPAIQRPTEKRIIEASLLMNCGADGRSLEGIGYDQATLNEAVSANYRGAGLHSIFRKAIEASGIGYNPNWSNRELVRHYHEAIEASGISTRDWNPSGLLSNVVDKLARVQSDKIASCLDKVLYTRSVKNFNSVTSGKLNILGDMPDVAPGADFPNAELSDSSQTYAITKKGVNLGITIEDQYNDDLGVIERGLQQFNRIFANAKEQAFFTKLASSSSTLFTAANGKKATLAFSAANLATVAGKFARIKDANGVIMNLTPGAILCSTETGLAADSVFEFNRRGAVSTDTVSLFSPVYNVYATPYMTDAANGWYLLPNDEYIGEVAYLNGAASPSVERAAINTKNLSIEFLVWGTCGTLLYSDAPAIWSKSST